MDSRLATALELGRLCYPPLADHDVERLVSRPSRGSTQYAAKRERNLPIDATKAGFLDLPRELRDQIYGFIIDSSNSGRIRTTAHSSLNHRPTTTKLGLPLPPPITRVSTLLRTETLPLFYSHTASPVTLLLDPLNRPLRTTVRYLLSLSPFHLSCIREFEIRSLHGGVLGLGAWCVYSLVYMVRQGCWRVGVRIEGKERGRGRVVRDVLFEDLGLDLQGEGRHGGCGKVERAKAEVMEGFLGRRGRCGNEGGVLEEGLRLEHLVGLFGVLGS
ncbi:hypothetical protein EJ03DRAFT_367493 [Teratosphaeria nubilosa]|uniref:F-box domain-containing protein n=1 Tax=Teratosphaeria nubilosa TaxID=161662 RepID=A0A6G1L0M8_9PEZI|nr:hypothetical protein EJ03DRAFT_367493 [Teratosphaeria nubilosa]